MRRRIFTGAALVATAIGSGAGTSQAAPTNFAVEWVDPVLTSCRPGVMAKDPTGDLVATYAIPMPGAAFSYEVSGVPFPTKVLVRAGGTWQERASQPPEALGFPHALVLDAAGRMRTISWRHPATDCRHRRTSTT
jgi:hypothetical protein